MNERVVVSSGEFAGKVAVVTGASTGLGESIAAELHARGASVMIAARDEGRLNATARRIDRSGERVRTCVTDVREANSVEHLIFKTVECYNALHFAVNNAGITGPAGVSIPEYGTEDWNDVIATNMGGVFFGLKYEIPAILRSGGGAIVNLSSANGVVGVAGLAPYTAAKHGVLGLTRSAALECADKGIRINAVGPGYVETPRMREMPDEAFESLAKVHPMGRMARREEVANLVAFLLSTRSSFSTGGFYPIDGGYTAR